MRILQIRFKNLNSLVGEWLIDLTDPAFVSDGIFAIIGPTGSGKTTILDAVCLALYGRTPRLNKVTRSGNEIMSRRTGECFAEVTFETQAGRFRCHWSQHRSRKKPGGELQAPKHEIAGADSGEVFESKIRGVAEHIETVTGMDFDRFTRSMLLAQGGFAAFLQAAPDERAPILEQITGTEIYSQISVRVHERWSDERKHLELLQAELAGMQLLSREEEQQLAQSLAQKTQEEMELTKQLEKTNHAITWIEGMTRLKNELEQLEHAKTDLQTRFEAFAPEQERLRLANQALELSADYAALTAIRKELHTNRVILSECRQSLSGHTAAVKEAEDVMKAAVGRLNAGKQEQQTQLPVLRQVSELDLKIAGKNAPVEAACATEEELSESLMRLEKKQKSDSDNWLAQTGELEKLQESLAESLADGELIEHLAGLRSRFDAYKSLSGRLNEKRVDTKQAGDQLREASRLWKEQMSRLETAKRDLTKTQDVLDEKQSELLKTLEGQDAGAWRKRQSALEEQKVLIGKTLEAVELQEKSRQALAQLDSRQDALQQEAAALTRTLEVETGKQVELEKDAGLLETQVILLKRIEDLEEARSRLQDGEPCPLCGALEHPFTEGNIPAPEETQQRLSATRAELKTVIGEISDLRVRVAQVNKDLEQTAIARSEHSEKLTEVGRRISANCPELHSEPKLVVSDPDLSQRLQLLREENARHLIHATGILDAADSMGKDLVALRETLETAREHAEKMETASQVAAHKKELAENLLERSEREEADYREQHEKSQSMLLTEIEDYGIESLDVETIETTYRFLAARRDQWIARNKQKGDLEQAITALDIQIRHQTEQIRKLKMDVRKQKDLIAQLKNEQQALCQERRALFGEKNAEEEEMRLSKAVESADLVVDEARQKLTMANQELGKLTAKIDELEKTIQSRHLDLNSAVGVFKQRFLASGFADEDHYKLCCLPEGERHRLARQSQTLLDERTEISSKTREKLHLLEVERLKNVTEDSLEELKSTVVSLVGTQRERQQEMGGIRRKLEDNALLKQQQSEKILVIDAQKRECARWTLLHELIGSADGKKYRNFAQGLAFEIVIGHANRQLQKMNDRYLLVHDNVQPLELNVVDNYQAGEIRSTKNLSGGESFIVSLALALGLSNMAGRNVRVDSLFLDEGFGTLDEESLDTALEALAGLHQDGKLIGVISHVPALRERISAQIRVTPQTGGRSRISGPGCSGELNRLD